MGERISPADLERMLASYKKSPTEPFSEYNLSSNSRLVAPGPDSFVFLYRRDWVAKVYKKGLSFLSQLELYRDITNEAAKKPWSIIYNGKEVSVYVNPVDSIYAFGSSDFLCTLSKRIWGKTLWSYDYIDMRDYLDEVTQFSIKLNRELSVSGISLDYENIKFVNLFPRKALVIIDLCSHVDRLKRN